MNPQTIIIAVLVFAVLAAIAVKVIRDKINHKSACSGCAGCACQGQCHSAAKQGQTKR